MNEIPVLGQGDGLETSEAGPTRPFARTLGLVSAVVALGLMWTLFTGPDTEPEPASDRGQISLPSPSDPTATLPTATPPTSFAPAIPPTVDSAIDLPPGWEDLGELGIPRYHATAVDTGDSLVMIGGGSDPFTNPNEPTFEALWNGIVVDHASGRVRNLRVAPPLCPNGHPTAVWTGTEMVVWGVVRLIPEGCHPAASYNPSTNIWRRLDSPLFREAVDQAIWLDGEVVDVRAGIAFSLDDGAARPVPSVRDSEMFTGAAVSSTPRLQWTGSEFLVLGSRGVIRVDPVGGSLTEGPAPPIPEIARTSAWNGQELLAVNYEMAAATFDPASGRWTAVAPMPLRLLECVPDAVAGDGLIFVDWCSGIGVWDGSGEWSVIANPGPLGELAVGGGYVYHVGERVLRHPLPETFDGRIVSHPSFVPIGMYTLDLPDGWHVTRISVEEDPEAQTISVDVISPSGFCRVSSTHGEFTAELDLDPIVLVMADGRTLDAGFAAEASDGRAHVVVEANSDTLDVSCVDPDATRQLAGQAAG